jgi:hypothetical protein
MQQGTRSEALELAKQRWASLHSFDIDAETWETLFQEHRATDVIEAIRRTRSTRAKEPSAVYTSMLYWLNRVEQERVERANLSWPPADVNNN